jgi:ribosomal protein L29
MPDIDAKARNVRELLGGKKYAIDYFQREYRWQEKQISELVTDLTSRFLSAYRPGHGRPDVAKYPHYFLGSIIVSNEESKTSVIDGQQRLTSLSILLIWVHHGLTVDDDRKQIADLIFTRQYGANAYNLEVPERTNAMDALYRKESYNRDDAPESVRNILDRYDDIASQVPPEIAGTTLAMFGDWLIEKVNLVEISAPSDDDGYAIFETMNDRGLALSPTDMLKSHLLANAGDDVVKKHLNELWKRRINELLALGKDEESDAIKAWLRSHFADSIRARQSGAKPEDFDLIGTEFHRWVRNNGDRIGVSKSGVSIAPNFKRFVERDFDFYTRWYLKLREAAAIYRLETEAIYCNAHANFTLQYTAMLAPVIPGDSDLEAWRKAITVATYIDILISRRVWSGSSTDYNTMQYAMFLVVKDIRNKQASEIADLLKAKLDAEALPFANSMRFGLQTANKKTVRRLLARLTTWLDGRFGHGNNLPAYLVTAGAQGYDIEHIMPDNYDLYREVYPSEPEFTEQRNRIGALLLLPKSFNRSYGGMPYEEKSSHYLSQNSLAQTLRDETYSNNPGLGRVRSDDAIPFEPFEHFGRAELEVREKAISALAERVWSSDRVLTASTVELAS